MPDAPSTWSEPMLRSGMWFAGEFFRGASGWYPRGMLVDYPGGGISLRTSDRTSVVQHRWVGGDAPVNLEPVRQTLEAFLVRESDYLRFEQAARRGTVHPLWLDLRIADQWYIPGGGEGRTTWKTSRPLPYGSLISGVEVDGDHAPVAILEDSAGAQVEQAIVASPGPSSGEVYVPDVGDYAEIETPSGLTESWLILRYPAVFKVRILSTQIVFQSTNGFRTRIEIEEALGGAYTAAA